jgi:hypothetical protein
MGIAFSGAEGGMAEKFLYVPDVGTVFQKMSRKAVAQAMDRGRLQDSGFFKRLGANTLGASDGKMLAGDCSREQPDVYIVDGIIISKILYNLIGQKSITVFVAFA